MTDNFQPPRGHDLIHRDEYPGVVLHFGYPGGKATRIAVSGDQEAPIWFIQHRTHGKNHWSTRGTARSRTHLVRLMPGKAEVIRAKLPELPDADQYGRRGIMVR